MPWVRGLGDQLPGGLGERYVTKPSNMRVLSLMSYLASTGSADTVEAGGTASTCRPADCIIGHADAQELPAAEHEDTVQIYSVWRPVIYSKAGREKHVAMFKDMCRSA